MASVSNPVVKVLKKAKKLIADPRHWIKGRYATTKTGRPVASWEEGAECFCAMGAVIRASGAHYDAEQQPPADFLRKAAPRSLTVPQFNDRPETTHTDVMVMFDKAIRLAEGKSA